MEDLHYIEYLRKKLEGQTPKDLLEELILKQPHSERFSTLYKGNKKCQLVKVVYNHYSMMDIGASVYFTWLDEKYKGYTCKDLFKELTKDREEYQELYRLLCQN